MSGPLFNLAIDPVLRKIQGTSARHHILAYAADLVLLVPSKTKMKEMLALADNELSRIGLKLNPAKCKSYLQGKTPVSVLLSTFHVNTTPIQCLSEEDFASMLGKPLNFIGSFPLHLSLMNL